MAIRVLRLIEYVYPDVEAMAEDMARWTIASPNTQSGFSMRSTALPPIVWDQPKEDQSTDG